MNLFTFITNLPLLLSLNTGDEFKQTVTSVHSKIRVLLSIHKNYFISVAFSLLFALKVSVMLFLLSLSCIVILNRPWIMDVRITKSIWKFSLKELLEHCVH